MRVCATGDTGGRHPHPSLLGFTVRQNATRSMLLLILVFASLALCSNAAASSGPTAVTGDDAELAALLAIVEEETELATKSKMNADYVPGIITILHGDDLEALGIRTVWEALAQVPSLQILADEAQAPSLIVRGFGFPFNSGNIKVLVDSMAASQEFSGLHVSALYLPIEVVERIEVIRGPSSSIYGNAAFMGLVNVITRKEARRVHGRLTDRDSWGIGGQMSWESKERPLRMNVAFSGWQDDDAGTDNFPDVAEVDEQFALLGLEYGSISMSAFGLRRDFSRLPQEDDRPDQVHPDVDQSLWGAKLLHRRSWSSSLHSEFTLSYLADDSEAHSRRFEGDVAEGRLDLTWQGWNRQSWLLGASYARSRTDEVAERPIGLPPDDPDGPPPGPPPGQPPGPPTWRDFGTPSRSLFSIWLQDQVDVSDSLTVTAGLRYDHFSDVANEPVAPRLAVVWHLAGPHILKAQYARGFRAPTFWELYALGERDRNLETEFVGTTELSYTYRRPNSVARATLFDARLRDRIFRPGPREPFRNTAGADSRGVEVEWAQQVSSWLKVDANVSYLANAEHTGEDAQYRDVPVASKWLGNLSLLARPMEDVAVGVRWHHVGDRQWNDPLGRDKGYDNLDLTLSWFRPFSSRLTLRVGVKNLLDEEFHYLLERPRNVSHHTYSGRTVWLQLSFGG